MECQNYYLLALKLHAQDGNDFYYLSLATFFLKHDLLLLLTDGEVGVTHNR